MAENKANENSAAGEHPSVYDDASALMMLSRGANHSSNNSSAPGSQARRASNLVASPHSGSEPHSSSVNDSRSLSVPADGLGTMLPSSAESSSLGHEKRNSFSSSSRRSSSKGMVAAAALATAATVPLPLKKQDQERRNSKHQNADNDLDEQKQPKVPPVPSSYIVDPDAGVITCICGFDDDDGFTIQCDHCNRWQHAVCYGIRDIDSAPDDHLCITCNPRKVDVKRAKKRQQDRLNPKNKRRRKNSQDDETIGKSATAGSVDSTNDTGSSLLNTGTSNVPETKALDKLLTAAEHYAVVYVPLSSNDYKDKYVEMFLDKHSDDDWVIPYNKSTFTPVPLEVKSYAENARSFSGMPKLGLFTRQLCPTGSFLEEVLGEIEFSNKYYGDCRNNYRIFGTTKAKVLIHPHWPICIDSRLSGNLTRFLRRSCQPNVELVSIRMMDERPRVKFVLRALKDIEDGEELHIGWQWDLRHPIWHLIKGESKNVDSLDDHNKFTLIHSIDTILSTTDCACGNNSRDCYLLKVKRYAQSLAKAVKSKTNSRYKLSEILQSAKERSNKVQAPILSRLAHEAIGNAERANQLLVNFHAAKLNFDKEEGVIKGSSDLNSQFGSGARGLPFKFYLIDKHANSKKQDNQHVGSVHNIDLFKKYGESQVTDLKALPLPVNLPLPPGHTRAGKLGSGLEAGLPELLQENDLRDMKSPVDTATSIINTGSMIVENRNPLKKKLSFADYKRKMKPV
ncbi:LADA_0C10110g1_1 [Lachancea dasiensis]|uniref:LADA_0C10110g1_1 n=1 Tax=Lachancea dasiensis TaxID=1072105 RepID=A0A1G4J160_9SACH|nr:LADA_0C10110g1_1 [Lachancea dasiensis]